MFQNFINYDDDQSCDLSNILSNLNYSTTTTSLDSLDSMQSIFELGADTNVILQGKIGQVCIDLYTLHELPFYFAGILWRSVSRYTGIFEQ